MHLPTNQNTDTNTALEETSSGLQWDSVSISHLSFFQETVLNRSNVKQKPGFI